MTHYMECPWLGTSGRLGNQLIQIAATIGTARRHRSTPLFPASWQYRHVFSVPDEWFDDHPAPGPRTSMFYVADTQRLHPTWRWYLQDVTLWAGHEDEVHRALTPTPWAAAQIRQRWRQIPAGGLTLGVHVRRGDNTTNDPGTINALPASYYRQAVDVARHRWNIATVVVVSDDPAWAAEHVGGDVVLGSGAAPKAAEKGPVDDVLSDWLDLLTLARCDCHVISNSTFAWMGWWLRRAGRAPVRPSYWVGEQLTGAGFDPGLLVPEWWPTVETEPEAPQC